MQRGVIDTSSILRDRAKMSTKLATLTQRAKRNPKGKFTTVVHLLNEELLKECYWELKRGKATGIDRVTVEEYGVDLEEKLKDLVKRMKAKRYRPKPVRRAYIAKSDGTKRPLGVPAVEDKVVQLGVRKILEAIFEVDFVDVSYGFRPKRSCHDALDAVDKAIMAKPVNYVVDMDIRKFFDTIDHNWLLKCVRQRIVDTNFLQLLGRFLRAGVVEEGKYMEVDKGTPQGGVISPVLGNIYLHYILDLWFEKKIKKQLKGYAQLVRYADDFVVCFQSEKEANAFGVALRDRMEKFGLKVAEDKSRTIEFGRYRWYQAQREGRRLATFDFLGITHYCAKSRKGKFCLGRKTAMKKYRQKIIAMNQWLKAVRNAAKLQDWWKTFGLKVRGHYLYYGISGNFRSIQMFHHEAVRLASKWINRRSQKRSYNWTQFNRFLRYNPLPRPKIYHAYPVIV